MNKLIKLGGFALLSVSALGSFTSCTKTGFKVGLLCLHGQTSTYDNNFIGGFETACKKLGLEEGKDYDIRTDVAEDYNDIYTAAKEWAEDGYSMVFADSFGHQYGLIDVAKEYPNTEFCHATGTNAIPSGLDNYHTAFASIYQGRYLAGYAAGLKMLEDIDAGKYKVDEARIGYVGAWPYAEVVSGYTSFYLGACHAFDKVGKKRPEMFVKYTYSWYDYGAEKEAALSLISENKCKLISQHADSMGSPQSCAAQHIPNVCYNISTKVKTPDTYLYGTKINWEPYFEYIISQCKDKYDGKIATAGIDVDYTGDLINKSVEMLEFGNIASQNIQDKVAEEMVKVANAEGRGAEYIFNCNNFTVSAEKNKLAFEGDKEAGIPPYIKVDENSHVTYYEADVEDKGDYAHDINVIKSCEHNGEQHYYFAESGDFSSDGKLLRSAPYFDLIIDGITTLN